jgi:hypothetical protein
VLSKVNPVCGVGVSVGVGEDVWVGVEVDVAGSKSAEAVTGLLPENRSNNNPVIIMLIMMLDNDLVCLFIDLLLMGIQSDNWDITPPPINLSMLIPAV